MNLKVLIHAHNDGTIIQREKTTCAIEGDFHANFHDFKNYVIDFIGIKDIAKELGFQAYDISFAKLVKASALSTETFAIRTSDQYAFMRESLTNQNTMLLVNIVKKTSNWDALISTKAKQSDNDEMQPKKKRKRDDREEDRNLVKQIKASSAIVRNERQQTEFDELKTALLSMNNSEAISEHMIRCGVCNEVKLVCAADRKNNGKLGYFKRKHYDRCLIKHSKVEIMNPASLGKMQQTMAKFLQKPSASAKETVGDAIELDTDLTLDVSMDTDTMLDINDDIPLDIESDNEDIDDSSPCELCLEYRNEEDCLSQFSDSTHEDRDDDVELLSPHNSEPDKLTLKMQKVIDNQQLPSSSFMYKFLNNAFDYALQREEDNFSWDSDVLEFFNSVQYLGGERTVNFLRGPVHEGQGRGGVKTFSFDNANFGGPSSHSRLKLKCGYTNKSGLHKGLVMSFHAIAQRKLIPQFENSTINAYAVSVASDGTALKPAIQFDPFYKTNVGLTEEIDIDYVKQNPEVKGEDLKKMFVSEAVVTFCTDLTNVVSMPVAVDYVSKQGKTGENILKMMLERIRLLQVCQCCLSSMPAKRFLLCIDDVACSSKCEDCLRLEKVCDKCSLLGHRSYKPALRACDKCIDNELVCQKLSVYVLTLDCESGNKQAMEELMLQKETKTIDAEYLVLCPMPDVIHVGKSLKCSFSNWFIMMSGFRGCLSLIRNLRKNGDPSVKEKLQQLLKAEDVRNRDRMAVDPVIRITMPAVRNILRSLQQVVCTIIPEKMRLEESNKKGMYCPVALCLGPYGYIVFIDYDAKQKNGRIVLAKLHYPVTCKIIAKDIVDPRSITCLKSTVFVAEYSSGNIRVISLDKDPKLKVNQLKKSCLIEELRKRNAPTYGTAKELQARLTELLKETSELYKTGCRNNEIVNFTDSRKLDRPAALVAHDDILFISDNGHRCIYQCIVATDGVGFTGSNESLLAYPSAWTAVNDLCLSDTKLYVSNNVGVIMVALDDLIMTMVVSNSDQCLVTGIDICCRQLVFADAKARKIKMINYESVTVDIAGVGNELDIDRDGTSDFASFLQPHGIACEKNTIYVSDPCSKTVKMLTSFGETCKFLECIGNFYSAFGIHLKGSTPRKATLTEAKADTLELQGFLTRCQSYIRQEWFTGGKSCLNGPEGMVADKTVKSVGMIFKSLEYLEDELNHMADINLQSFLTGHVEHFHATSHIKTELPTMHQHTLAFHDIIKESIKRIANWSVKYFTHRHHYYPVPSTAIRLSEIPLPPKTKPVAMDSTDRQLMLNWAEIHGKCVRQRTVRSDNTKDRAGTLPETAYEVATASTPSKFEYQGSDETEEYDNTDNESEDEEPGVESKQVETFETEMHFKTITKSGRSVRPIIRLDL